MRMTLTQCICLAAMWLVTSVGPARADLVGYWTLDDLAAGIANSGTNGSASDLSIGGNPTTTTGIIGDAVAFDGTGDMLSTNTAGNAADALSGYPVSFSYWINASVVPGNRYTGIAISQLSVSDVSYGSGVNSGQTAYLFSRNTNFDALPYDAAGSDIVDGQWHNVVGTLYTGGTHANDGELYVDGKLIATSNTDTFGDQSFNSNVDTIGIGGLRRSNAGLSSPTDAANASLDDVGLFNNRTSAVDAALINGLGRTAGVGLDQLAAAHSLNNAVFGATAVIGGQTWHRVSGLSGTQGDFGGSVAGGNAYVVTDNTGDGISLAASAVTPPILVEHFDYNPGSLSSANSRWSSGFTVTSPGLDARYVGGESGNAATGASSDRSKISLGQTVGSSDQTVYLSFLMQTDSTAGTPFDTIELYNGSTREYAIGLLRNDGNTSDAQFEQRAYQLSNTQTPDLGAFTSDLVLIVAKFVYTNSGDALTIDAWLNPDGNTDFNAVSNRITIASGAFSFDSLAMAAFATNSPVTFDEIRLASTPPTFVPTPAALPAGAALLGLVTLRRRRRSDRRRSSRALNA